MRLGMCPSSIQPKTLQQCNCHDCHFHLKWQSWQFETQQSYFAFVLSFDDNVIVTLLSMGVSQLVVCLVFVKGLLPEMAI